MSWLHKIALHQNEQKIFKLLGILCSETAINKIPATN
jgi:hypothetical protein